MKKEFSACPSALQGKEQYGFSWMEHVLAIPSPLVLVTTYKNNGKPNATLQSWSAFVGEEGFYCIFGSVNRHGHMYSSIKETNNLVINFPSADIYKKCLKTIENNRFEDDEITKSGLTAEKAATVNAPRIRECFLNLECEFLWEKKIIPNAFHSVMCAKVLGICMDEEHFKANGRYGESGYLYNIHSPANPETGEKEVTSLGIIQKYKTYEEL